jgi:hypothetical protein
MNIEELEGRLNHALEFSIDDQKFLWAIATAIILLTKQVERVADVLERGDIKVRII